MRVAAKDRLDSWKEIADYLGRDVRTVMRWEKERGLPIRRVPGASGHGGIFAYRAEVDTWLQGTSADLAAGPAPDSPQQTEEAGPTPTFPTDARSRPKLLWAALVGAVVVALAAAVLSLNRAGVAERVTSVGNKLLAWDAKERLAWSYSLPAEGRRPESGVFKENIRLTDLDGDGRNEVLAVAAFPYHTQAAEFPSHELYCFSERGQLLWRYQPKVGLSFKQRHFEGPWHFKNWAVSEGNTKQVWLAVNHWTWWPAYIVKLDSQGRGAVAFVNSGSIYTIRPFRNHAGSYLLAAGVNNEYQAAMLAILEENQTPAASPQTADSSYKCVDCPQGIPYRYILFPRSELNVCCRAGASYNEATGIQIFPDHFEVFTSEVLPDINARIGYSLPLDFDLSRATLSFSAGYWRQHQEAELQGKLKHSAAECPERKEPKKLRVWARQTGWTEVVVHPAQ